MLLASMVRFITGNIAAICTLLCAVAISVATDRNSTLFFTLSLCTWLGVRYASGISLQLMILLPLSVLLVLLLLHASPAPVVPVLSADAITLVALAYRGWTNKRLLD